MVSCGLLRFCWAESGSAAAAVAINARASLRCVMVCLLAPVYRVVPSNECEARCQANRTLRASRTRGFRLPCRRAVLLRGLAAEIDPPSQIGRLPGRVEDLGHDP